VADLDDEIIMQGIKEGNLAGMSVLFERYHLRMYNYFLKLTMKKEISQDLTQNLFYRLIKYKHTYKKDYTFKSWIYQDRKSVV
jgi:DNA-directed RNA polymerase specialized sigma24 family protein